MDSATQKIRHLAYLIYSVTRFLIGKRSDFILSFGLSICYAECRFSLCLGRVSLFRVFFLLFCLMSLFPIVLLRVVASSDIPHLLVTSTGMLTEVSKFMIFLEIKSSQYSIPDDGRVSEDTKCQFDKTFFPHRHRHQCKELDYFFTPDKPL